MANKKYPGEEGLPRPDGSHYPGRVRHDMSELMALPLAIKAALTRAEAIAVVLYTGPPYMLLNGGLRRGGLAERFFFNISEHADGERRGSVSI